jgi:hypothetical protein
MTSHRQIEANRRNGRKSTGPITKEGKRHSRCNAVRHGLTAETVIGALVDAEDYKAFETAIIADFDAQSAVEREPVLRLASLLWRRAVTMEPGLFQIQADQLLVFRQNRQNSTTTPEIVYSIFGQPHPLGSDRDPRSRNGAIDPSDALPAPRPTTAAATADPTANLARCLLRLANLPNYAFDRLSRYEANLWRQVSQTLFTLACLDRRKPGALVCLPQV